VSRKVLIGPEYSLHEQRLLETFDGIARELDLELYDLDYRPSQKKITAYIQNPMTKKTVIEDCVKVDRAATEPLEADPTLPEDIVLEVSSPGVYRRLRTQKQLQDAVGQWVKIKLMSKADLEEEALKNLDLDQNRGVMKSVNDDGIEIEVNKNIALINFKNLKSINCDPDYSDIVKGEE
jgi:ribosome maturation factor RimP